MVDVLVSLDLLIYSYFTSPLHWEYASLFILIWRPNCQEKSKHRRSYPSD
jgi:hypothetical protein